MRQPFAHNLYIVLDGCQVQVVLSPGRSTYVGTMAAAGVIRRFLMQSTASGWIPFSGRAAYSTATTKQACSTRYYQPCSGKEQTDGVISVNGSRFSPFRRYRTGPRLRQELEPYGFRVHHQTGE